MNQYEAVLAAARQAVMDQTLATSQARYDREQSFLNEMEPVLRAEARRRGRNSRKEDWLEDEWGSQASA
ncbi:MAG: hypothetical protein ACAI44_27135 [Candidatus Sericytochromatia bacterium]